jgi:hypothetical protein
MPARPPAIAIALLYVVAALVERKWPIPLSAHKPRCHTTLSRASGRALVMNREYAGFYELKPRSFLTSLNRSANAWRLRGFPKTRRPLHPGVEN